MGTYRIACHLIIFGRTLRDRPPEKAYEQALEEVFAIVAEAGYDGVEGVGARSADHLVELAVLGRKYGLSLVNAGGPDQEQKLRYNITLGNAACNVPEQNKKDYGATQPWRQRLDDATLRRVADDARPACQRAAELGIKPFQHTHMGKVMETVEDAHRLLSILPELTLLYDTGHLAAAGSAPIDVLRDSVLRGRLGHVHLKDTWVEHPAQRAMDRRDWHFEELGQGNVGIEFGPLLSELEATGYRDWISVEQYSPTSHPPAEAARLNRQYLRRLGY